MRSQCMDVESGLGHASLTPNEMFNFSLVQLKIISLDIWEPEYWQGFQLSRSIPEMML